MIKIEMKNVIKLNPVQQFNDDDCNSAVPHFGNGFYIPCLLSMKSSILRHHIQCDLLPNITSIAINNIFLNHS